MEWPQRVASFKSNPICFCLEHGISKSFYVGYYLESLGSNEGQLLCMECSLERYVMDGLMRRGWTLVNRCFMCKGETVQRQELYSS